MVVKTKSLGTLYNISQLSVARNRLLGHIFTGIACIVAQRRALPRPQPRGKRLAASVVVSQKPGLPLANQIGPELNRLGGLI
jgi:hypothetical protein